MAKQLLIALVTVALVGGSYFFVNYEIQSQQENGRTICWRIVPGAARRLPAAERRAIRRQDRCVPPSASPPTSLAGSMTPSWPTTA